MPDLTDEQLAFMLHTYETTQRVDDRVVPIILELRARRAECWRLREAMIVALELIHLWHGDAGWSIYALHSPEMRRINAALAPHQPTGQEQPDATPQ